MTYGILPYLQVKLFLDCPVLKSFKEVFMRHLIIVCITIYRTTIISNTLDKVASSIKLRVVED